jgi:seryl-tRNA synthetase
MSEINGKIQDLEAADNLFKDQIATLTTELAKKVDQTDFDKAVADITGAISGEIARAKEAEQKLQEAIDKINNVTIPALQAQVDDIKNVKIPALETEIANLKSGKLDKAEFEAYKSATATTIKLIQDAIQNLADTKLDKTVFDEKVAEILAKFDDYVLVKDFEAF